MFLPQLFLTFLLLTFPTKANRREKELKMSFIAIPFWVWVCGSFFCFRVFRTTVVAVVLRRKGYLMTGAQGGGSEPKMSLNFGLTLLG